MNRHVRAYKVVLRLYPAGYRQEYEAEMVQLFEDMLCETQSNRERIGLLLGATAETLRWASPEIVDYAEASVSTAPRFIKMNTLLALLCLAPFAVANLYQLHMLYDREARPALIGLLMHTRSTYAVALPALGLTIAVSTMLWSLVRSERYWHESWIARLRSAWRNSLLLFGLIGLIAAAILN